ncbi:unnamed protein product [Symbiodinium sp. CCMP2456]|nr:unnamed protein product [Symbiodinium sp. CCMP2456]
MWDQLKDQQVVRTALVRHKSSKEKPGAYIPKMMFTRERCDICPQRSLDTIRTQFDEEIDIGLANRYAYSCRGRSMNMDNMKAFYRSMLPASKKGRRTAEQEEVLQTYQHLLGKLEGHEKALTNLLAAKHGRRLRAKKSVEDDALGVQSLSRRLQFHVVDGHTIDLDIQNCCLTLLQQILAQTAPQPPMPDDLAQLMDRLVKDRAEVLKQLGLDIVEGKEMINTVMNGGAPPTSLKDNELVQGLQKISLYIRWVACNLLHADYMSLAEHKQKPFLSSTILSLLWTSVEDRILQSWTDHILSHTNKPKHLSLHFDGVRISAEHVGDLQEEYIKECENAIQKRTGFTVKIVPKKHFIDLVKTRSTHANALTNVPDILLQPGNCIPCALWHVVPLSRPAISAAVSNTSLPQNVEAKSVRYRDYRSVPSMCHGRPHAVAVRVDASGNGVTVIDGATVYKLNMATSREIHCAAVDHSTVVSYWKKDPKDKKNDKSAILLDMVAGARDVPDDLEEDSSEGAEELHAAGAPNKLSFDEDNVPVFNDNILQSLKNETSDVFNDLQKKSTRSEGNHNRIDKQIRLILDAAGPKYVNVSAIGSPLQDIVTAPIFLKKMEDMNRVLLEQDECHYIMDATLKLCMKLMGQASYRSPKSVRNEAPFGDDVAWRRLLTIRGRTGAVLLLHPLQNESADQVVDALAQNFSAEQLRAVVHVGTDQPSEKLFNELKAICPSMRSLVLDPIHLAVVYECGFWNKHSPGSKQLRRILQKCISIDADLGQNQWGAFYDGTNARPLPFTTRLEFIRCLAALCRRYPTKVTRKIAGANKQISKILWSACAPDRLEWLMNNLRVRHALPSSYQWFLPSGTSSNEALRAEINSWSRSTNVLHRSTLALKLKYFRSTLALKLKYFSYIKLLLHYLSVQYPLSHTVSASMMLSRSLHRSLNGAKTTGTYGVLNSRRTQFRRSLCYPCHRLDSLNLV